MSQVSSNYRGIAGISGILTVLVRNLHQIVDIGICATIARSSTELYLYLLIPLGDNLESYLSVFENCSDALEIPKGILLKQKRPNGIRKVVR